jgi:hypothetical protein
VKLINCRSEKGGATKRAPANWTTSLATVFQSKYPGTITTYYPYSPVSNTTSTPSSPSNPGGRNKIPTWLRAVIGVILGTVIGIFLVVWSFCRRRSKNAANPMVSEADSRLVHESGGGQVHELGEYSGYNIACCFTCFSHHICFRRLKQTF